MAAIVIPALVELLKTFALAIGAVTGIVALATVAEKIADFIAKELSDAMSKARACKNCECSECEPPVGTPGYQIDWVPPSVPHPPCTGSHAHFFIRSQDPETCECAWNKKRKKVLCLDGFTKDDFNPDDLGDKAFPVPRTRR